MKLKSDLSMLMSLIAITGAQPGCSLFIPEDQRVTIEASEPDAQVWVDGEYRGRAPLRVMMRRDRTHTVTAKVDRRSGQFFIDNHISVTGVLDVIGGIFFLLPFLGALGGGFMVLDVDHVTVGIPPAGGGGDR